MNCHRPDRTHSRGPPEQQFADDFHNESALSGLEDSELRLPVAETNRDIPGEDGSAALNEAARAKTHAQEERTAVAAENIQASKLFTEAERADVAQREIVDADNTRPEQLTDEGAATYDSAERREALAKSLDHVGDWEAVETRLVSDRNPGDCADGSR